MNNYRVNADTLKDFTSTIKDLDGAALQRLRDDLKINQRIDNFWPLICPRTFRNQLKFEHVYYQFDEVKNFISTGILD